MIDTKLMQGFEDFLNTESSPKLETMTVKWFNDAKGYGFATDKLGRDIFIHYTAIQGEGFKTLTEGQQCDIEILDGPKGPQAVVALKRLDLPNLNKGE